MLALKGIGHVGLAVLAVTCVLLASAVVLIFTLVGAAPLRLLQTR